MKIARTVALIALIGATLATSLIPMSASAQRYMGRPGMHRVWRNGRWVWVSSHRGRWVWRHGRRVWVRW